MFVPALVTLLTATPAELPTPPGFTFPPETVRDVTFDDLTVYEGATPVHVRGHLWRAWNNESPLRGEALWAAWKPLLVAKGWKVLSDVNGHTLARANGKAQQRLLITVPDYDAATATLVDVGGAPMKLELKAPGPKPRTFKADEDFPFAPAFPGQERSGTMHSETPFIVAPATDEARLIAEGSEVKTYSAPKSLSRLEGVLAAADALKRAGWDVVFTNTADGFVQAHYTKEGRDLWLHVGHAEDGTTQALSYAVVDLGNDDLGKQLDKSCTLTLRGVNFDFNKATLKPESESTLATVAKALTARPALKLEVRGHTDSVGDDASNLKLSEARAAAVASWLSAHGVTAARLTSRGYGETQPVADNDSDAGRAKNRRVELSCVK